MAVITQILDLLHLYNITQEFIFMVIISPWETNERTHARTYETQCLFTNYRCTILSFDYINKGMQIKCHVIQNANEYCSAYHCCKSLFQWV